MNKDKRDHNPRVRHITFTMPIRRPHDSSSRSPFLVPVCDLSRTNARLRLNLLAIPTQAEI